MVDTISARYNASEHQHRTLTLFLAINDIDHTRTKVKSPRTNGICERFHKTGLQEFYQVAFHKKLYDGIETPQADLDEWLYSHNHEPHTSRQNALRRNTHRNHAHRNHAHRNHDRRETELTGNRSGRKSS